MIFGNEENEKKNPAGSVLEKSSKDSKFPNSEISNKKYFLLNQVKKVTTDKDIIYQVPDFPFNGALKFITGLDSEHQEPFSPNCNL